MKPYFVFRAKKQIGFRPWILLLVCLALLVPWRASCSVPFWTIEDGVLIGASEPSGKSIVDIYKIRELERKADTVVLEIRRQNDKNKDRHGFGVRPTHKKVEIASGVATDLAARISEVILTESGAVKSSIGCRHWMRFMDSFGQKVFCDRTIDKSFRLAGLVEELRLILNR